MDKKNNQIESSIDVEKIIEELLRAVGLNAPTFAKRIGVNYQRIFDLQRGRVKKFNPEIVAKIKTVYPWVNTDYLYLGIGKLRLDEMEIVESASVSEIVERVVSEHLNGEEYQQRLRSADIREEGLNRRAALLDDKDAKLTALMEYLTEKDRRLDEKERELRALERDLKNLEASILKSKEGSSLPEESEKREDRQKEEGIKAVS